MTVANKEWICDDRDRDRDSKKPVRDLSQRREVIGNQLAIVDAISHKWDKRPGNPNVEEDHQRCLDGKDHDEFRILSHRKEPYAKKAIEHIAEGDDSLRHQKFRDTAQLGCEERLSGAYVVPGVNRSFSLGMANLE